MANRQSTASRVEHQLYIRNEAGSRISADLGTGTNWRDHSFCATREKCIRCWHD